MHKSPNPEHGFKMLRRAKNLAFDFNRSNLVDYISFAKACIWFGMQFPDDIIAEACAIGGDHQEARFETLLMEGENIHWRKCADGSLSLLID